MRIAEEIEAVLIKPERVRINFMLGLLAAARPSVSNKSRLLEEKRFLQGLERLRLFVITAQRPQQRKKALTDPLKMVDCPLRQSGRDLGQDTVEIAYKWGSRKISQITPGKIKRHQLKRRKRNWSKASVAQWQLPGPLA